MALLKSAQSGNWDSASTWNVCTAVFDGTATQASTASTISFVGTATAAYNSTFNAIGLAVKICGRAATITGTITVQLSGIAGTSVTVNAADVISASVPTTASAVFGHWIFFKFASPVAITNGTTVIPQLLTSTTGVVTFARVGTTSIQSFVVTEETKAPAAGDTFCIIGDNSAAGKGSAIEVVMNNTTSTLYGPATAIVFPAAFALYVGDNATLTYGTAESTNYNLRISGHVGIGAGGAGYPGTLNIGTTTTPMPRTSTATLEIVGATIASAAGANLCVFGGRLITQGLSRTAGKNVDRCLLTANAAIGATSLTVDTDTGWLSGDSISVAPSARVAGTGLSEHNLTANATTNTLTINPAIASSIREGGSAGVQAEVMLITRNVIIRSATPGTINIWVEIAGSTSIVDCDWTRFTGIGSSVTNRIGIYLGSMGGSGALNTVSPTNVTFNNCVFHQNVSNFITTTAGVSGAVVTDCTFTNATATGGTAFTYTAIGSGTSITNTWCANLAAVASVSIRDYFPITGLRICCSGSTAMAITPPSVAASSPGQLLISNTYIKCSNPGIIVTGSNPVNYDWSAPLTFNNIEVTRCNGAGLNMGGMRGFIFDNFKIWTNSTQNISNTTLFSGDVIFRNGYIATQSGSPVASGISSLIAGGKATFENCQFGAGLPTAVAHTQDILPSAAAGQGMDIILRNCILASATEVATPLIDTISVISENHDQAPGNKKIWLRRGTISTDTSATPALVQSGTRSIRLQPNSSTFKLEYTFAKVAVAAGTTPTVGIYVRKSVGTGGETLYTGDQPRLVVKRNVNVGITSDTVLATASAANGTWELLSGTLPTLTADGVVELEVDCASSSGGWVNIDSFQAPAAVNTKGLEISDDTLGVGAYGDNSTGGGGSPVTVGYAFVG